MRSRGRNRFELKRERRGVGICGLEEGGMCVSMHLRGTIGRGPKQNGISAASAHTSGQCGSWMTSQRRDWKWAMSRGSRDAL